MTFTKDDDDTDDDDAHGLVAVVAEMLPPEMGWTIVIISFPR